MLEKYLGGLDYIDKDLILLRLDNILVNNYSNEQYIDGLIQVCRTLIEKHPNYDILCARIMNDKLNNLIKPKSFTEFLKLGVDNELINKNLLDFNLISIENALSDIKVSEMRVIGLTALQDRYLTRLNGKIIERVDWLFMRVAMGLAIGYKDTDMAIEFYNVLANFDFMSSTPTLFNSGTNYSQLSSCYLSTVGDSITEIFKSYADSAQLSKFAGGLGNDFTPIRATGSYIKGTNGISSGLIPYLKIFNDVLVCVNQSGRRLGSGCAYLETWHLDIEDFLELRKNTGDEHRRCHDMNTANWIPDLFMKRVINNEDWTLFSPSELPLLHETYGKEFELIYTQAEKDVEIGKIKMYKKIPAVTLWRKMLTMLFETGNGWFTFKDPSNIRSPQQHVGVVHSSNLCTEINLNTSSDEIAVCNLGSINMANHLMELEGKYVLDHAKLEKTIKTAITMLDNVIDINFYPVKEAENSNLKHRPIGMGIMGFQDCLYKMGIAYDSEEAIKFADESMEIISYYALTASNNLAKSRGAYSTFKGSLWDKGILPIDSIRLLSIERGREFNQMDISSTLDWEGLRVNIQKYGLRNSNCMAIAPTATISNIVGVSASIEPTYENLYAKQNLSGDFAVINKYLVSDLIKLNLWNDDIINKLKSNHGSVQNINEIPEGIRNIYKTAFEISPMALIKCASRRQKWIDQSQSLNLYIANASGKLLDETYKAAWLHGLKTTYYLRTKGATKSEQATVPTHISNKTEIEPKACYLRPGDEGFDECESCQ
jgi:ribonucleoside-diphosphate reductase alpha chain